ncbi:mu-type opioid receptor-like [Mya arenaria]|uniref:mu-type opioid receptor-like n=1 Tax=Mya arenaria TaxID=6604 RepID=UPI0022E702B1|nr:mu-type opioid receptor-like [Mya arenaria]
MVDSHMPTSTISFGHTVNNLSNAGNGTRLSHATESELLDQLNGELKRAVTPVTVFVGIEIVLGLFGNLLVLYMFIKRYHDCNFRYFVLCLAFLDVISTLTTMPGEILTQQYWYMYPFPTICKVKSFFNVFMVSGAAFCLCTIAVDRYRKVCAPFGWQIRPRHAIIMCGAIYGAAFIISLPSWFLWGIHQDVRLYNGRNVTVTICGKDARYVDSRHLFVIATSVEVILGICLVITLVLYILVAKTLIFDRKFAGRSKRSGPPMVSKSSRSQAESYKKPEITNSDVSTRNGESAIEFSITEMRSPHDSESVAVIDVCVLDAETTCEVWTSEERHIQQNI